MLPINYMLDLQKLSLLNMQREHFLPSLYAVSGCSRFNELCTEYGIVCVVAYFINVSGMFLSLLSLFRLLYIFPIISSLSTTLYCVN